MLPLLIEKAGHDVSEEARAADGTWTGGGTSMPAGLHTKEGADAIVGSLRAAFPGAKIRVVGSVATRGRSKNDIDIFAPGGDSEPRGSRIRNGRTRV